MALSISSAMQAAQDTSPRLAEGSRGVPHRRAADARAGAAAEVDVNHLPRRMVPRPGMTGRFLAGREAAGLKERVQLDCGEAFYDPAKQSGVEGIGRPLSGVARAPRSCTSTLDPLSQKHTREACHTSSRGRSSSRGRRVVGVQRRARDAEVLASCRSSLTASPLESQCGDKARRRGPAEHAVGQRGARVAPGGTDEPRPSHHRQQCFRWPVRGREGRSRAPRRARGGACAVRRAARRARSGLRSACRPAAPSPRSRRCPERCRWRGDCASGACGLSLSIGSQASQHLAILQAHQLGVLTAARPQAPIWLQIAVRHRDQGAVRVVILENLAARTEGDGRLGR